MIKHWETVYTSKWDGQKSTHINSNAESDARGWTRSLANDHSCKAECYEVHTDGRRIHVMSEGHDSKGDK